MEAIFGACPLERTTSKEKTIYINEARRSNYPMVLTGPPPFPCRLISFSEVDVYAVHFSHNDALIITMHIDSCRVSRILSGSTVNILYGSALDRTEDTPEITRDMIGPQTQSNLYGLTEWIHSPGTITLSVCAYSYNVTTQYVIDMESPNNAILERSWIHMIKVVTSSYHQLLRYPTLTRTADIRGN